MTTTILRNLSCALLLLGLWACGSGSRFELTLPSELKLTDLRPAQKALLRATLEVTGLPGGESALEVSETEGDLRVSGYFELDLEEETAGQLTVRLYGRMAEDSDEVLLVRLVQPVTLKPGGHNSIVIDQPFVTDGSRVFDQNRNGKSNLRDLQASIDPGMPPPFVAISPDDLQFFSGIRLGDFERRIVLVQNLTEDVVEFSAELFDAPGVLLDRVNRSGEAQREGARRTLEGAEFKLPPRGAGMFAVSFAPLNTFLSWGVVQVTVRNTITGVTQPHQVTIIANSGGALQPELPGFAPLALAPTVDLGGFPPDQVAMYPADRLFDGREYLESSGQTAALTRSGSVLRWGDAPEQQLRADRVFLVEIPAQHRFSATLTNLQADLDLAVLPLGPGDGVPTSATTIHSRTIGPEAVSMPKSEQARRVLLVLTRADDTDNAVELNRPQSFSLSTHVVSGPEFDEVQPLDPLTGPLAGGIRVVLRGRGFEPGARVTFASVQAVDVEVTASGSEVHCTLPPGSLELGRNPATVVVANPTSDVEGFGQAATLPEGFTYLPPAPVITQIAPLQGPASGGTPVTIRGAFFSERLGGPRVRFGEVQASAVQFVSPSELSVESPSVSAAGPAAVVVENLVADGSTAESNAATFTYAAVSGPAPTLTSVTPATGSVDGNTRVLLTGNNYLNGATVRFGARAAASARVLSPTQIEAYSPAGAAGVIDVTVINPDGQFARLAAAYTYTVLPPQAGTLYPALIPRYPGAAATEPRNLVVVEGSNFRTDISAEVQLVATPSLDGGAPVDAGSHTPVAVFVNRVSINELWLQPPLDLPAGHYQVRVFNSAGQGSVSGDLLRVFDLDAEAAPRPVASHVLPASAEYGVATPATLYGGSFDEPQVHVGKSGVYGVTSMSGGGALSFVIPPQQQDGSRLLRVVNADGQYAWLPFTVVRDTTMAIHGIQPASGSCAEGSSVVVLAGQNFDDPTVLFAGVRVPTSSLLGWSGTEIAFRRPSTALTGGVTVRVTNADGATASTIFTCSGDEGEHDSDGDRIPDAFDNCPYAMNGLQQDEDNDGVGDHCDNCVFDYNPDQFMLCAANRPMTGERGGACLPGGNCLGDLVCLQRDGWDGETMVGDPICHAPCRTSSDCSGSVFNRCGVPSREIFLSQIDPQYYAPYPSQVCMREAQRFEDCSWDLARCADGLSCLPSQVWGGPDDSIADKVYHCQQRCDFPGPEVRPGTDGGVIGDASVIADASADPDTGTGLDAGPGPDAGGAVACPSGETCVATISGMLANQPGAPSCYAWQDCPDGPSCPCDPGYQCRFDVGNEQNGSCVRPVGVCGTAVDTQLLMDQLASATRATECTATTDDTTFPQQDPPGRLCTQYEDLWWVACYPDRPETPARGHCAVLCSWPTPYGYSYFTGTCPDGQACRTEFTTAPEYNVPGAQGRACQSDEDCVSGMRCTQYARSRVCAYPAGFCATPAPDAGQPDGATVPDASIDIDGGPVDTTRPIICGDYHVDPPAEICDFGNDYVGPCQAINPGLQGLAFCYECQYLDTTGCSGETVDAGTPPEAGSSFCGNNELEPQEACDWGPGADAFTTRPCAELGQGFSSGTAYCFDCMSLDTHLCSSGEGDAGVQMDSGGGACGIGAPCMVPADCTSCGLTCNGSECVPSSCSTDGYNEPSNDTYTSAYFDDMNPIWIPGATACQGDVDWYQFVAGSTDEVRVTLWGAPLTTPPTFALYHTATAPPVVTTLTTSGMAGPGQWYLAANMTADPNNFVRVAPSIDYDHWYDILIQVGTASFCIDDFYESNDSTASPTYVSPGVFMTGAVACPSNSDYWAIYTDFPASITAAVQFTGAWADVDIQLVNVDGVVLASSAGASNLEQVSYAAYAAGYYYLHVYVSSGTGSTYGLQMNVEASGG